MTTVCPSCSYSAPKGVIPNAKPGNANLRAVTKVNSIRPRYTIREPANPPDRLKPVTVGQATLICRRQAPRGDWRQRAGKEKSRNLRDPLQPQSWRPCGVRPSRLQRESEGTIVAGKQGNACGAKGSHYRRETIEQLSAPLAQKASTEIRCVASMESELETRNACRRAGCGKSARPVR